MATVNLGRVKPVNKGTWSSATTYAIDDFVQYTDNGILSTYIAVAASSNQTPSTSGTENGTYWKYMSKGTSLAVGNNKIITTDSSGNAVGLAMGTAGQAVKVNSAANGFEFGTAGGIIQSVFSNQSGNNGSGTGDTGNIEYNNAIRVTITPTSSSNKIVALAKVGFTVNSGGRIGFYLYKSTDGGSSFSQCDGGVESGDEMYRNGGSGSLWHSQTIYFTDSSPSTSSTIYTVYFRVQAGGFSLGDNTGNQQMLIQEVQV